MKFKQICPVWDKRFEQGIDITDRVLNEESGKVTDIHSFSTCIVGEAWNFSFEYYYNKEFECDKCYKYCLEFSDIANADSIDSHFRIGKLIRAFTIHWTKKHPNI